MRHNRKVKGSITIFLCIIITIVAEFLLVILDAARVNECAEIMSGSIALSVMSAGNSYDKEIYYDLDLILYTMDDATMLEMIRDTLKKNSGGNKESSLYMNSNIDFSYSVRLATNWCWMGGNGAHIYVSNLSKEPYVKNKYLCPEENSYDEEANLFIRETLEASKSLELLKDYCRKGNLYSLCYDYLPDMGCIDENAYLTRFSSNTDELIVGGGYTRDDFAKADTNTDLSADIMCAIINGRYAEKREKLFRLGNNDKTYYYYVDWAALRYDDLIVFLRDHFEDICCDKIGKSGLKGEMEYLLYGNASDRENVAKVLSEIFKMRLYMNTKTFYEDADEENVETRAFLESWYDTLLLYNGGSIPWKKNKEEFVTTKKDTLESVKKLVEKNDHIVRDGEQIYEDYLMGQFYLSCLSGQIVCGETLCANFFDLLQYTYGVDIGDIKIWAGISAEYSFTDEQRDAMLSSIGRAFLAHKTFNREYNLGG